MSVSFIISCHILISLQNSKPPSKAKTIATKKAAAPPPVKKTAAAPKKALAGKAKSTATKKTTSPSKRGAAKKVRCLNEIDAIDSLILNG